MYFIKTEFISSSPIFLWMFQNAKKESAKVFIHIFSLHPISPICQTYSETGSSQSHSESSHPPTVGKPSKSSSFKKIGSLFPFLICDNAVLFSSRSEERRVGK